MKKLLTIITAIICICFCANILATVENTYHRNECTVISSTGYSVVVKDRTGTIWNVSDVTAKKGDRIDLVIHTNYTQDYEGDDYVLKAN